MSSLIVNLMIDLISGLDEGGESRDYQPEWFPVARMNYLRRSEKAKTNLEFN